jgi:hypothetical protein
MNRETLTRVLLLVLAAVAAAWVATVTEWAEVEVERPPRGEAARNPFFALEQLARELGVRLEHRKDLASMPPAGVRLVLTSPYWDLFPERSDMLRQWVEAGGHLVLPGRMLSEEALQEWLPLAHGDKVRSAQASRRKTPPPEERHCRELEGADSRAGTDRVAYKVCVAPHWRELVPGPDVVVQWVLQGPEGIEMLRVPFGRGSVTAYGPMALMHNRDLTRWDHALAASAALQLQRGSEVWVVAEESRQFLLAWVWRHGWVALLLVLAAIAAWLWRSAIRFGPLGAVPAPQRRSMGEQIAGTGAFLRRHGTAALHAAQVRALQETARVRLPGYARLPPAAAIESIAKATGLDAAALARALDSPQQPQRSLPHALELLETARRRLRAAPTPRFP